MGGTSVVLVYRSTSAGPLPRDMLRQITAVELAVSYHTMVIGLIDQLPMGSVMVEFVSVAGGAVGPTPERLRQHLRADR